MRVAFLLVLALCVYLSEAGRKDSDEDWGEGKKYKKDKYNKYEKNNKYEKKDKYNKYEKKDADKYNKYEKDDKYNKYDKSEKYNKYEKPNDKYNKYEKKYDNKYQKYDRDDSDESNESQEAGDYNDFPSRHNDDRLEILIYFLFLLIFVKAARPFIRISIYHSLYHFLVNCTLVSFVQLFI
jgi:hypothetical protein